MENQEEKPNKKPKKIGIFFLIPILLIISIILSVITIKLLVNREKPIEDTDEFYPRITKSLNQQKEAKKIINVLIAGVGGEAHSGGTLTDTIIFASIDTEKNKAATMNIPRDLYVDFGEKYGYAKINAANVYGEEEKEGSGMLKLQNKVEEILDQNIKYYVKIDFDGFKTIVDKLGGININVEKDFTDYQYPTLELGYKTVSFKAGTQYMDGETALIYSRSRHGNNGEGNDFARSKRQQQILTAIKEKMLSTEGIYNPTKIFSLLSELKKSISTNIGYKDIITLYKAMTSINKEDIITKNLSETSGYVYVAMTREGASIVKPTGNNYDLIRDLAANIFDETYNPIENISKNLPKIVILNGTSTPGLASKITEEIKNLQKYSIYFVGNYNMGTIDKSTIYDTSEKFNVDKTNLLNETLNIKTLSKRLNIFNSYDNIELQSEDRVKELEKFKNLYSEADIVLLIGSDLAQNQNSI